MSNSNDMMNFMDLFTLAIFAYVTYCGVFNRGQLYKDDTVHESKKEQYHKMMRNFALVLGPVGLAGVVLQMFGLDIIGWILQGLCFGLIIVIVVFCYRMTDQYVKKQAAKQSGAVSKKSKTHK